jgi:4-carboxymuconolactone decarboxylase
MADAPFAPYRVAMSESPKAPRTYDEFVTRFPALGRAWELLGEAGREGPLDEKTGRLVKLAVAIGAMREGAVHSAVRKALASGVTQEEIEQVIALAASTVGLPSAVAVFSWIRDTLNRK